MRNGYLKKGLQIKLILLVLLSFVACDFLSKEPEKVEFLDNSFAVIKPASWALRDDLNDVADLQMGNPFKEAYAIIITENKMDFDKISLEEHSDLTRSALARGLKNYWESDPEYLKNGSFRALRYKLTGTTSGLNIVYWHVTLETEQHYHQMLLWSLKSKFAKNEADFLSVIQSFEVIN